MYYGNKEVEYGLNMIKKLTDKVRERGDEINWAAHEYYEGAL